MLATVLLSTLIGLCDASTIFEVPIAPGPRQAKLDAAPIAFSFEFVAFPDIFTNVSNTQSCLANLKQLTGTWPRIRIGGTSEDESLFDRNLDVPIINTEPKHYRYGPAFLSIAAKYKGNVVMGLNRGANIIRNSIEAAKASFAIIPNLYAVEFGNEPVIFPYFQFPVVTNASNWNTVTEAQSESQWQIAVGKAIGRTKFVQAGNFILPSYTAATLFASEDPAALKYVRTFAHHNYPQSAANTTQFPPTNLTALQSHVKISANIATYAADTEVARQRGMDWVFGETNSVSGGGSREICKTFGAALWVLDYSLRATSNNVARLYFHHGWYTTSFYIWWTPLGVTSPYYGGYAATKALAGAAYISALDDGSSNYAGYIVYSAAKKPIRAVLINTDYYDGSGLRGSHIFKLKGISSSSVSAKRLKSSSALSRQDQGDSPTFGGQTFSDQNCQPQGKAVKEIVRVSSGVAQFAVAASEALIVDL